MTYRGWLPKGETGSFQVMTEYAKRACNRTWNTTVITMEQYFEWFTSEIDNTISNATEAGIDPYEEGTETREKIKELHRWISPRLDGVSYIVMCLQNQLGIAIKVGHEEAIRAAFYRAGRNDQITFHLDKSSWDDKMKYLTPLPDHWGSDPDGPDGFVHGTFAYNLAMISSDRSLRGSGDERRARLNKMHVWHDDGRITTDGTETEPPVFSTRTNEGMPWDIQVVRIHRTCSSPSDHTMTQTSKLWPKDSA